MTKQVSAGFNKSQASPQRSSTAVTSPLQMPFLSAKTAPSLFVVQVCSALMMTQRLLPQGAIGLVSSMFLWYFYAGLHGLPHAHAPNSITQLTYRPSIMDCTSCNFVTRRHTQSNIKTDMDILLPMNLVAVSKQQERGISLLTLRSVLRVGACAQPTC